MINSIKKMLGIEPPPDYRELMKRGAVIVDVRTRAEYQQGHIKGSLNIPLNNLSGEAKKLKTGNPVITCCASGMRSAQAKGLLKSMGVAEVYNGGGWLSLQGKIR